MDANDSKGALALKRHLQKYIKKLVTALAQLEKLESSCKTNIRSLANLLEQRECISKVDTRGMELVSQFPDLKARLMVKLSSEVDIKLENLRILIEPLKDHHEAAYKARSDALSLCSKYSNDLEFDALCTGQPTVPPIATMLEWVDKCERQFREIFYSRQYYLDNIADETVVMSDNLISLWSEDVEMLLNTVRDCEEQTRYFREEKM